MNKKAVILSILVFFLVNMVLFIPCSMAMTLQTGGSHGCCNMPDCSTAKCFSGSLKGLISSSKNVTDNRTLKGFVTDLDLIHPEFVKFQDENHSSHFLRSFFPASPPVDLFIKYRTLLI